MRRWALARFLLIFMIAAPAIAQVQTVGDVSFAVPEGWSYQGSTDSGLMLLKQDANFWIITVHPPRAGQRRPERRFQEHLAQRGLNHAWLPALASRIYPVRHQQE